MPDFDEYDVVMLQEGALGTLVLGGSGFPLRKLRDLLNSRVADGWQVVFQVIEVRRFLLFWRREAVIVTLGRKSAQPAVD